jgi:hypothetical protein
MSLEAKKLADAVGGAQGDPDMADPDYLVCLDTSVLFDLVQKLETGKPPEWWSELKALIEAGNLALIVLEIR